MRTSIAVSIAAAALTTLAIGWCNEMFTSSRGSDAEVRDRRPVTVVRDLPRDSPLPAIHKESGA
jgi:hypothetical protein